MTTFSTPCQGSSVLQLICIVCREPKDISSENEDICCDDNHLLCHQCIDPYVRYVVLPNSFRLRESLFKVRCPVHECSAEGYALPELYSRLGQREKQWLHSILDDASAGVPSLPTLHNQILELLSLKCPGCGVTVDPSPDACSAVLCLSCGAYYCNYCFECFAVGGENGRSQAHMHVAQHNPAQLPDAFLPQEVVSEGQRRHRECVLLDRLASSPPHTAALAITLAWPALSDLDIDGAILWRALVSRSGIAASGGHTVLPLQRIAPSAGKMLATAIKAGNRTAAMQLLSSRDDLDINYVDLEYGHPLGSLAVLCSLPDVAQLLASRGADPLALSSSGRTFLYIAVEFGLAAVVRACLATDAGHRLDLNAAVTTEAVQVCPPPCPQASVTLVAVRAAACRRSI